MATTKYQFSNFWKDREYARRYLIFILIIFLIIVQSIDQSGKPLTAAILMLVVLVFFSIATSIFHITTTQLSFNIMITLISTIGSSYFFYLSTLRHLDLSILHKADYIVVRQMNVGRIPLPIFLFNMIPVLATPAGMNFKVVKYVVCYNIFTFIGTAMNVFKSIDCFDSSCQVDEEEKKIAFFFDVMVAFIMVTVSWFCCIRSAEIGSEFIRTSQGDHQADAMLSNILKNSIAGASCLIEIEQEEIKAFPCSKCGPRHRLSQARYQLLHSMRWCMSRSVLVELTSGGYKTRKTHLYIPAFLEDIQTISENCDIEYNDDEMKSKYSVKIDESMARVAVENGLFNAISHGSIDKQIELKAQLKPQKHLVSFTITNIVSKSNISQNFDEELQLQAERVRHHSKPSALTLASMNSSAGLYRVSIAVTGAGGSFTINYDELTSKVILNIDLPAEFIDLSDSFKSPTRSFNSSPSSSFNTALPSISSLSSSTSSTSSSSSSSPKSPKALMNELNAKLSSLKEEEEECIQQNNHQTIKQSNDLTLIENEPKDHPPMIMNSNSNNTAPLSSTQIMTISDIPTLGVTNRTSKIRSGRVGSNKSDLAEDEFPMDLKVCAIDDSKMICKGYERLLLPLLKCDSENSLVSCPKSQEDVKAFMQVVLPGYKPLKEELKEGRVGRSSIVHDKKPADIVILDQNIDLNLQGSGLVTVLGTDLAVELRAHDYQGLVIIRSANSSSSDFDSYMASQAVDACVGKSESHKDLAAKIRNIYQQRVLQLEG